MAVNTDSSRFTLAELAPGQAGTVVTIAGDGDLKRRLAAMGLIKGVTVYVDLSAPLGDPRVYRLMDYLLSLRNADARKVIVAPLPDVAS